MQNAVILLDSCGGDTAAFFDSQQLMQTVVNLLLNALEASAAGGRTPVQS